MSVNDSSRIFLVQKFVCAKCGTLLNIHSQSGEAEPYATKEPTGADKVSSVVGVWPCQKCYAPVERVRAAIAAIIDVAGKEGHA